MYQLKTKAKLYSLTKEKKWIVSFNSIIFYFPGPLTHFLIEIVDMRTKNQKHIKLVSEQKIFIKGVQLSEDESRLILRLVSNQKNKQFIHIIQLTCNKKYPSKSFILDEFVGFHFYSKDLYLVETQKSVYMLNVMDPEEKEFLVKDQKIFQIIIGTHLNIVFIICENSIRVIWMTKINHSSERKIKQFPRNNILDIIFVKDKLFLMKETTIEQADLSYFDSNLETQTLIKIKDQKFKNISFRNSEKNQLQLVALSSENLYILNTRSKQFKTLNNQNFKDGQVWILNSREIWIYSKAQNSLFEIREKDEAIWSDKKLGSEKIEMGTIILEKQKITGGIRSENKQNQLSNLSNQIFIQAKPLFFTGEDSAPQFYGSEFVQFESIYSLYAYMHQQKSYFDVDDVKIPIRQLDQKTKSYIPQLKLQMTAETKKNIKNIIIAIQQGIPILLQGEAGCGKTANVQFLANKTNTPLFRINLNNFTSINDILGKSNITENNQIKFFLSNFTTALQKGYWVLLDQANLSRDQVLNVIQQLFSLQKIPIVNSSITGNIDQVNGILNIRRHPRFQLFLAQNPGGDRYSSRNTFSESFLSNMICLKFASIPIQELKQIVNRKLKKATINSSEEKVFNEEEVQIISSDVIEIYEAVKQLQKKENSISNLTIRDLLQICDIFISCYLRPESLAGSLSIKLCFTQTLLDHQNKEFIYEKINKKPSFIELHRICTYFQKLNQLNIEFIQNEDTLFSFCDLSKITKKPGLIYSEQCSGKLSLILKWAQIRGIKKSDIIIVNLTKETQVADLYGKTYINDDKNKKTKYIFKDGPVKKAIKEGKLLILKGLNKVDASVSESLNGILETGENRAVCIYDQYINIHPNTLIFATASIKKLKDTTNLSPALLSRFFSIHQPTLLSRKDLQIIIKNKLKELIQGKDLIINTLMTNQNLLNRKQLFDESQRDKILKSQAYFFLDILKKFIESQVLLNIYSQTKLKQILLQNLEFFVRVTKQKKLLIKTQKELKYPFDYTELMGKNYYTKPSFKQTLSRKKLANAIAFCISSKLPIVLEGKAGIGKSKIIDLIEQFSIYDKLEIKRKIISINQNTTINDLMGTLRLTKDQAIVEIGSLKTAMQKGMIVLLDEFNLANDSVLCFIQQLLKYPESIIDPVTGNVLQIHKNFRILGTQNPSSYAGRSPLPESIKSKVILIEVPLYSNQQIVDICMYKLTEKGKSPKGLKIQKQKVDFLVGLFAYVDDDEKLKTKSEEFQKKSKHTTLRNYIKLCNRLKKLYLQSDNGFYLQNQHWKQFIQLNCTLIFPEQTLEQFKVPIKSIDFEKVNDSIQFKVASQNCEIKVSLPLNQKNEHLIKKLKKQSNSFQRTMLNVAFCKWFKENPLLMAETSHKSTVINEYFSKLIKFKLAPEPLTIIYLSNLTQMSEILGSIEPHTRQSYRNYIKTRLEYFTGRNSEEFSSEKQLQGILQKYRQIFHAKEIANFDKFMKQTAQFFTICERNLLPAIRYGGIILLQNINLPEQSKMQGLNSLFEIDQNYTFDNQELNIHEQFMAIATVHLPTSLQISPALRSRFTIINIQEDDFLEKLRIQIEQKKTFNTEIQAKFVVTFIKSLKILKPSRYKQLNQKHLSNWLKFNALKFQKGYYQNQSLAQLIIGSEILFVENLQIKPQNLQEQLRKIIQQKFQQYDEVLEVYRRLQKVEPGKIKIQFNGRLYLNYMRLQIKKCEQSPKFIFSKTTIRNIFRFLCASETKLNLNLQGPPGIGKTAICAMVSQMLNKKFIRICCSENMQIQDLLGSYIPIMKGDSIQFFFQIGKLLEALKDEKVEPLILFDEINLAPSDVLSGLIKLFNSNDDAIRIKDNVLSKRNAIFICAMNPPDVGGGRKNLPDTVNNELVSVNLSNLSTEELKQIVSMAYKKKINKLKSDNLDKVFEIHSHLEEYQPNIRHFQNLAAVLSNFEIVSKDEAIINYYCTLACLLTYQSLTLKGDEFKKKKQIQEFIVTQYGYKNIEDFNNFATTNLKLSIQNGYINLKRSNQQVILKSRKNKNVTFQTPVPLKYTQRTMLLLEKLLLTIESNRILLIQGKRVSGKTSLALQFARLSNRPFLYFCLNSETEIADFLGGICPTHEAFFPSKANDKSYFELINRLTFIILHLNHRNSFAITQYMNQTQIPLQFIQKILENCQQWEELKNQGLQILRQIKTQFQQQSKGGIRFKFNKGILRYAMKHGYLLILDNIDLAKPVVIERFNSLGQEGGQLHINQAGAEDSDQVHPDFRIICISNPDREGAHPLSEAFKNRVIKIQIQPEFINPNFQSHLFALLNSDTDPTKQAKHYSSEYKIAESIKLIYEKIIKKQYNIKQNERTKGFTINQKNIVFFKKIANEYGVSNALPLFLNFFQNIQKDPEILKIQEILQNLKIQRPKTGVLQTQNFQSLVDEKQIDVQQIKTVKNLALHIKNYGQSIFHQYLIANTQIVNKQKINSFDGDSTCIYKVQQKMEFNLANLRFLKIMIEEITLEKVQKTLVLKGQCAILNGNLNIKIQQSLNENFAMIKVDFSSLKITVLDQLQFIGDLLKQGLKKYFSQLFEDILSLPTSMTLSIMYKNSTPQMKLKISFKNKISIFNFFDLGGIRCQIDIERQKIELLFHLSKNGYALGQHTILLNGNQKTFKYANQFSISSLFKILDIPQFFNIIPITNFEILFNYESVCVKLNAYSQQIIQSVSVSYFNLKNPKFSIQLNKEKGMQLFFQVDLYFKEKKIAKLDKDMISFLKKNLQIKEIDFSWSKSQNFNVETQIIPILQEFNIHNYVISLVKNFFNALSQISVKFEKTDQKNFKLQTFLNFNLNQQALLFTFKNLQFDFEFDTKTSSYELFIGGAIELELQMIDVKKIRLNYGVDLTNKDEGLKLIYNFDPPLKNLSDLVSLVVKKSDFEHITLDKFDLSHNYISLREQILRDVNSKLCLIKNSKFDLHFGYELSETINPFGFDFIQLKKIRLESNVQLPSFKYNFLLSGESLFFKTLSIQFVLNLNNEAWLFEGKMLKNSDNFNQIISYFVNETVSIPALTKNIDCLKKANYNIKSNEIDLILCVDIGLNLKLFMIKNASLSYQGVVGKNTSLKIHLETQIFGNDYLFVYDYKEGIKLPNLKQIEFNYKKQNFNLEDILPKDSLDLFIHRSIAKDISIGELDFSFKLSDTKNLNIFAKLNDGKVSFSFGNVLNFLLSLQKFYLQLIFFNTFKFSYAFQLKSELSINQYKIGWIHIKRLLDSDSTEVKYEFNKINTKQLMKAIINQQIPILPEIVQIEIQNNDFLTEASTCKIFEFQLNCQEINLFSNLLLKDFKFYFLYDKSQPQTILKIKESKIRANLWFKTLNICQISGEIRKFQNSNDDEHFLYLNISSPKYMKLSNFFEAFLNYSAPTQLEKIQLSFEFKLYYCLFKPKSNGKNIKDMILQVSSKEFKALDIWNLFKLKLVEIFYKNQDWNVHLTIILFDHELLIKFQKGQFRITKKVLIQFNKIVGFLVPALAKVFNFSLILNEFNCDFGNRLYIQMISPPTGGEWVIFKSNNQKLLYLNDLKFQLDFNKKQSRKKLNLSGSFFVGNQKLVKIDYLLEDGNNKMMINQQQGKKFFNVKNVIKLLSDYDIDFLPNDISARLLKIDYDNQKSKGLLSFLSKGYINFFESITQISLTVEINKFSINDLPFNNMIEQAKFQIKLNNSKSGIQKIYGSSISGLMQICDLKLDMNLSINDQIKITAKSTAPLSLNKLIKSLVSENLQMFCQDVTIEKYQLQLRMKKNEKLRKYEFEEFKFQIKNKDLEIFSAGNLKLTFKSFKVVKSKQEPVQLNIQVEFLDKIFNVIYKNNTIRFASEKQSDQMDIMKILDNSETIPLQAKFKDFSIQKKKSNFIVCLNLMIDGKISKLDFLYSTSSTAFVGVLKSQYFPPVYQKILETCFGVKKFQTTSQYMRGCLKNIDQDFFSKQNGIEDIVQLYNSGGYSKFLRIRCKIKIDNFITRLLDKHDYQLNLMYEKHDKSDKPKVQIDLGNKHDPFQSQILPNNFNCKCVIAEQTVAFILSTQNSSRSFKMQFLRRTQKNSFLQKKIYLISMQLKLYSLFDIFDINGKITGEAEVGKKNFQFNLSSQIQIKIIPLDFRVKAAAKFKIMKKKFGLLYLAFDLQNFSLGDIIAKLFNVGNQQLLGILSWIPKIKKLQILNTCFGVDLDGQLLPNDLVEKGFPAKIYPFHRFCSCQLQVLGASTKCTFQLSCKAFMIKYQVSSISLLGILKIDAFDIDIDANLSSLSFNKLLSPSKISASIKSFGQQLKKMKISAKAYVKVHIQHLIYFKVEFSLSSDGIYAKLEGQMLGLQMQIQVIFNSSQFTLKAGLGNNTEVNQQYKNKYFKQFQNQISSYQRNQDQQVQNQMQKGYSKSAFSIQFNKLSFEFSIQNSTISINFVYDVIFLGFRHNGKFCFSLNQGQKIIDRFIKQLLRLILPDWLSWWKSQCQNKVEQKWKKGVKSQSKIEDQQYSKQSKTSKKDVIKKPFQDKKSVEPKNKPQKPFQDKKSVEPKNQPQKPFQDKKSVEPKNKPQKPINITLCYPQTKKNQKPQKINLPDCLQCTEKGFQKPPNYAYCFCRKFAFKGEYPKACKSTCKRQMKCGCKCSMTCHESECKCNKQFVQCFCKKKKQMHEPYDCGRGCSMKRKQNECNHLCPQKQCHEFCTLPCKAKCRSLLQCGECYCQNQCGVCSSQNKHLKCKLSNSPCYCGKNKKHQPKSCGNRCLKQKLTCSHLCTKVCHQGNCKQCVKLPYQCCCGRNKERCEIELGKNILPCQQKCLKLLQKCKHQCGILCHTNETAHYCSFKAPCFCGKYLTSCFTQSCKKICAKPLCPHKKCQKICHSDPCKEFRVESQCSQLCEKILSCGHKCNLKCSHNGPCVCNVMIQQKCELGLHLVEFICGSSKPKCAKKCDFKFPECKHECKAECYEHSLQNNLHLKCLQQIVFQIQCYQHTQTKLIKCSCTQKANQRYSCHLKCAKVLSCSHICQSKCHKGKCVCTSSTCPRCNKQSRMPCNGLNKSCDRPCRKKMMCGHQCPVICHVHNIEQEYCCQKKTIQCLECKNHLVQYKCAEGYNGNCPEIRKIIILKEERKINKKRQDKKNNKQQRQNSQNQKLLIFDQPTVQKNHLNKLKLDDVETLNLDNNLFGNVQKLSKIKSKCSNFILSLIEELGTLCTSELRIRIIIDESISIVSCKVYECLIKILELMNMFSFNVEIIISGDIQVLKPYYLKTINEPLNIEKIIRSICFLSVPKKNKPKNPIQCQLNSSLLYKIDALICFTSQNLLLERNYFSQIDKNSFIGQIFLIDNLSNIKKRNQMDLMKFIDTDFQSLCKQLISKNGKCEYQFQQPTYQTYHQKSSLLLKDLFQNKKEQIFKWWKQNERKCTNQKAYRIPFRKVERMKKSFDQNELFQKVNPQPVTDSAPYIDLLHDLNDFFNDIINEGLTQLRRTAPDFFTKNAFSIAGIITEKGIIKAQCANYTINDFFEKKIAGPSHSKPTFFVFDLTSTSQSYLIQDFVPVILTLILTLQKIKFPFGICVITHTVKCVKLIQQKFEPSRLFQAINESLNSRNNVSTLLVNGIDFGAQELANNSQRNSQPSLIVVTNSLHLISTLILAQFEERCLEKLVKLNVLTFLKYNSSCLNSCYYLQNAKQLPSILKQLYTFGDEPDSIRQLLKENLTSNSSCFDQVALKSLLDLNKNQQQNQPKYKQKQTVQQILPKNKFMNVFMQYFKKEESDDEDFEEEDKEVTVKQQIGEKKNAIRFMRSFRLLLRQEQKNNLTFLLQKLMEEIVKKTKPFYVQCQLNQILKQNSLQNSISLYILLLRGELLKIGCQQLSISSYKIFSQLLPIISNPELCPYMMFQNLTEFSFSVYNICLQHNSLKTTDQNHFLNDDTIKIHPNIEKIIKEKTVIYRQKQQNIEDEYHIMIVDVPLKDQKFKVTLIPGSGLNKQIPRYALADKDIYEEIVSGCIFLRQFDCDKFSPHDITGCANLNSEGNCINLKAVNELEMTADQQNGLFYVKSLFDEIQDTVIVEGNIRYLCFAFKEKGQQVKIQQIYE